MHTHLADPKSLDAWSHRQTDLIGPDLLMAPTWEKQKRSQEVYSPSGNKWRDAWRPDRIYSGGRIVEVPAELHQIPLFTRVGSGLELGDLNLEYRESLAIARQKPDLVRLDAELRSQFQNGSESKQVPRMQYAEVAR